MSFIKHAHECDVTADVAIRVDALEDLLNEWNATLSKAERKQTHSMGAELGNISEGRQRRWTLATEDDIPEAVSSVMELFESVGLPYREETRVLSLAGRAAAQAAPLSSVDSVPPLLLSADCGAPVRASAWPPSPARIGSRRREMRRGCRIQNDESRREERS